MRAEEWQDSGNVVARVNLPNMRIGTDRVDIYAHAVRGLLELEPEGDRRAKYTDFIDIYANLTQNERRRYEREHPEESSTVAGIVQRAREEGMQQGMQRGMQRGMERGRVEGERAVLGRLLQRRFGRLPAATVRRLDGASQSDLESWADNVLDAGTLEEVFG